jgi:hypothetical protein
MTRAIIVAFHKYTPFGGEYYQPLFDYFIHNLSTKTDVYDYEYDKVYFLDSTWNFTDDDYEKIQSIKGAIIKVDPSLRYYDAYKSVLPQIKEDLVLFMDNDMVVYKEEIIEETFMRLEGTWVSSPYDVVSIYDTIGTMKVDLPNGKNKFCPYFFATKKELLMKYLDIDWSPDAMPYTETFGLLTEAMLKDGCKPYEFEEDKNSIYFDGTQNGEVGKDLGYYHIRSGSTPAYLLATKGYGNIDTYTEYLTKQPKNEYLRQFAWYYHMSMVHKQHNVITAFDGFLRDVNISPSDWGKYIQKFTPYHGL